MNGSKVRAFYRSGKHMAAILQLSSKHNKVKNYAMLQQFTMSQISTNIRYDQFREQDRTCPPPSPTPPLNPSSPTPPTQGACGDGTCQTKETPLNCPAYCADSTPASKSTYEFLVVDGKSLEMDLYSPPSSADSGSSPAVVLIHGGAFRAGDKQQLSAWR